MLAGVLEPWMPCDGEGDERRGGSDPARRQLRQVDGAMPAGARELDLTGRELRLDVLLRRLQRAAAGRDQREQHLIVLEVGRLEPRLDAVRKGDHGDAELGDLAAAGFLSGVGQLVDEHGAAGGIGPRRHGDGVSRGHGRAQLFVARHGDFLLLRRDGKDDAAGIGQERLGGVADVGGADRRRQRLDQLLLVLDARAGLALQEVVHVLLHVRAALGLVALGVGAVVARQRPFARALELAGGEAVALDAVRFDLERRETGLNLAVLHARPERERIHGRRQRAAVGAGAEERRVGLARDLIEALVQHRVDERVDEAAAIVGDRVLAAARPPAQDRDR